MAKATLIVLMIWAGFVLRSFWPAEQQTVNVMLIADDPAWTASHRIVDASECLRYAASQNQTSDGPHVWACLPVDP